MKGGFGCSPCCGPTCEQCTRTCTEPHSGDAFEVVYTRKFEGVEVGNPSDGYLTATGDSDTSDPYDGMDGTGPWFQQVGGGFSVGGSGDTSTRFGCTYRFSFWRTTARLGAGGIQQPSTALTENVIELIVSAGAIVFPDGRVITAADGAVTLAPVPLMASSNDPRTFEGTVSFAPQCMNVETLFSIRARVRWNVQMRQHVVYGIVRECYEDGFPCATACEGTQAPNVAYLTISNYTGPTYDSPVPMDVEGTYVLERAPGFCDYYYTFWNSNLCFSLENPLGSLLWAPIAINNYGTTNYGFYMAHYAQIGGVCGGFELFPPDAQFSICGDGVLFSGTNGKVRINGTTVIENAFDWEIEV